MSEILHDAKGSIEEVVDQIASELQRILVRKRKAVEWKLLSVKVAFEAEVRLKIMNAGH